MHTTQVISNIICEMTAQRLRPKFTNSFASIERLKIGTQHKSSKLLLEIYKEDISEHIH